MTEITTQEVEFTADGTLLEVLRVVDVKDSIVPVRLRIREWIDERHYRDIPAKTGALLAAIGPAALVVRTARRSRTKPPPAPRDGTDLRTTPVAVPVSLQVNGVATT
jgi:hypothetical protein